MADRSFIAMDLGFYRAAASADRQSV